MQLLFAVTLLTSAALLFVVEPMFAKMVLPLLGGSPSVWNTCLVFYQAALLGGYVYAHVTTRWLGPRRQAALHLALLCLPWLALLLPTGVAPLMVPAGWTPPPGSNPMPWLSLILALRVGLPFLMISASAPLLQAWFAASGHRAGKDPYFLYAASNLGSMIGLLAYPFWIESHLTRVEQAWSWVAGYGVLMVLVAGCAVWLWRSRGATAVSAVPDVEPAMPAVADGSTAVTAVAEVGGTPETAVAQAVGDAALTPGPSPNGRGEKLTPLRRLRWMALAAVPSSLLLGVTTHISTDIAAVPLLWVVPLALYLLSFVLVFARRKILPHRWMVWAQALLLVVLAGVFYMGGIESTQIAALAVLHLGAFFATAMVCHGELAADRPASSHLTEFYLWMSVGGVLGGLFNALVAPLIFSAVWEYPLMMVAACLLRPRPARPASRLELGLDAGLLLMLAAIFALTVYAVQWRGLESVPQKVFLVALAGLAAFCLWRRPSRFAFGVAAVAALSLVCSGEERPLYSTRSFFGVLRVEYEASKYKDGTIFYEAHRLLHGSTLHGMQSLDPVEAMEPWTYYHRTGPVGDIFTELETRESFRAGGRIGVVGLGTGSIAAYGLPGQHLTYFEIDPAVERIARNPKYFTYLTDCRADLKVRLGDARLSLTEIPDGHFDVLLVDAFSSDAIPLHLLTREAMKLYFDKLAKHGILAVHISNRHLDLAPVLGNLAEDASVEARVKTDVEKEKGKSSSTWVVLARTAGDLGELDEEGEWEPVPPDPDQRLWTDDFSNIVSVISRDRDWKWIWEWWKGEE